MGVWGHTFRQEDGVTLSPRYGGGTPPARVLRVAELGGGATHSAREAELLT